MTLTCPIQVTLGEDGSGFSKAHLFFPLVGNIGEAWPLLMLPLFLSLLLREEVIEICDGSIARPGLSMDLEEIFMEEEDKREAKQMNRSLVLEVRWDLSISICFTKFLEPFMETR